MFKINYKHTLKLLKQLDWKLIAIVLVIFMFGLVVLSSATHANATGNYIKIYKQLAALVLGVGMLVLFLIFDYNFLGKYYKELYVVSLILLFVVLIPGVGTVRGGASSWISFGSIDLQTSELVKFTFVISYAKIVESRKGKLNTVKEIGVVLLYAAPFLGMLMAQPDLGGAIVFMCIIAAMLFIAGLNAKLIKRGLILIVVLMPLMYLMMASHQKDRIEAFLNPEDVSLKGNYQVMQSLISIGSGGVVGKGIYNGSQNQENFLPVQDSDFVFAVIGEEMGAIGMGFVILMFAMFILRLIYIAKEAKDFYGTLIVIGIMGMFAYQIVQNIGMTVALIPVTGVTLPFISAGASSVMTSLAEVGLVLNVYMRRKKINF
ncbi:MAG: FtsW/RodA/SpoVE family cell cycle protein [Clostridioides sp.]|jgi:rod shape determining protein RodA|nr:FtsW/RodA/SpoVE family cell cycle protein [Clostridioides sp.]